MLTLLQGTEQSTEAMSHLQVQFLREFHECFCPCYCCALHQSQRHGQHLSVLAVKECAALLMCIASLLLQLNPTSAGDSAPYPRRASSQDDVVIVSALRTPVCKVHSGYSYLQLCVLRCPKDKDNPMRWAVAGGIPCCMHSAKAGAWISAVGMTLEA
jgi:hypothetical protein